MARLGSVFLNIVYEDKPNNSAKTTDHPIENGLYVTDHIERKPLSLPITGVIIGSDAQTRKKKLEDYMSKGVRLKYVNRTAHSNLVIEDFTATYDVDVKNGFKFTMSLKQIRVVEKAEKIKKKKKVTSSGRKQAGNQGKGTKKIYTVVKGDNLSKIAKKFGTSTTAIYNKNKKVIGSNRNAIFAGQRLVI